MNFLGVKISEITKEQALQKVADFLNSNLPGAAVAKTGHTIFTPNPEMIVKAQEDEYFKTVLNSGDLNLCDGFGLWLATSLSLSTREGVGGVGADASATPPAPPLGKRRIDRITGVDFMLEICKLAAEKGSGVYLLGSGNDEVVSKACEELNKKFPNLKIAGYNKGPEIQEELENRNWKIDNSKFLVSNYTGLDIDNNENNKIIDIINSSGVGVLFVAFGMGKQEKWIYENLAKMPNVKIAMGVGGSFDFISGKAKRAPLFLRKLGLEWVYRLVQEPRRIGRIFNATVKFCYLFFKSKI